MGPCCQSALKLATIFYICRMIKKQHKTHLLLGGNLGDRPANLSAARALISERIGHIVKASGLYETQAWGKEDQPDFLNQALEVATSMRPTALLQAVLAIEQEIGRQRGEKWDARTIDIDILFYNAKVLKTKDLEIPHPFLHERNFALVPMLEIAPFKRHPVLKQNILELYEASMDNLEVVIWEGDDQEAGS